MANDFAESMMTRASGNTAQTPIVTIVGTVEQDIDHTEAQRVAGVLRREVMASDPVVQNVDSDYTVNSFGAETASAISWEDGQNIRSLMRMTLRDEGYTVAGVAIMAEVQTTSL